MVYKTLNNWVAKAFVTELSQKNYRSCIYIYSNNYHLLRTHLWEKLLWYFFNMAEFPVIAASVCRDCFLLQTLNQMYQQYEDYMNL